jgi:hypothetical protein
MIRLILYRIEFSDTTTRGVLTIDGLILAVTLEDADSQRDGKPFVKTPGTTAIPLGTYALMVTTSPRFKRFMPLVFDVPQFSGVRIHTGNTHTDTDGCILVADSFAYSPSDTPRLQNSRPAFDRLMDSIGHCTRRDMAQIIITH